MKASVVAATGERRTVLNRSVIDATTFHALEIDVRFEANGYLHPPVRRDHGSDISGAES